jgi:3,4-dihydroxy 2-butanone 4-phosphate synthase / GTP cyclohydrolase II
MIFLKNEEESIKKVEKALLDIKNGKMIVLTDNEDRENEGDLCIAAEKITPEAVNFMAKYGRGLICLTLTSEHVEQLKLKMMVNNNESAYQTAFTISIEAREGVSTGISAKDRAHTILTAIDDNASPKTIISPGHIFPLKAQSGGVLVRIGQTEGSVDIARLSGLKPSGVICEIMNDDGSMARQKDLEEFCEKHDIVQISIKDLVTYRLIKEPLISENNKGVLPIKINGVVYNMEARVFSSSVHNTQFLALSLGEINDQKPVLVRMHHGCMVSDVFNVGNCDCGKTLRNSMELIAKEKKGVIVYIDSPDDSLSEYFSKHIIGDCEQQVINHNYGLGAQILRKLGVSQIKLMTHHDYKITGIKPYGLEVVEYINL